MQEMVSLLWELFSAARSLQLSICMPLFPLMHVTFGIQSGKMDTSFKCQFIKITALEKMCVVLYWCSGFETQKSLLLVSGLVNFVLTTK